MGQPIVVGIVSDLLFASRLAALAERLGLAFRPLAALPTAPLVPPPALAIVDLAERRLDPLTAIRTLKALHPTMAVLAFGPHRDLARRDQALAAGADLWLSNQRLVSDLPRLLPRWVPAPAGDGSIADRADG